MNELEKLLNWLKTYPQWDSTLQVDYLEHRPGSVGVFPQGLEEKARREDVVGNVQAECRYQFAIYRHVTAQQDGYDHAQWLLDFQNWVQKQSVSGLTPHFGDVPAKESMLAQKGKWKDVSQTGTGNYVVTLVADFIKLYEVNE